MHCSESIGASRIPLPAHAGMTGTLDVMLGKLRDAAAAHGDN